MKEFSKVAGYRINTHNYLVFLYTNNKLSQTEINNRNKVNQRDERPVH